MANDDQTPVVPPVLAIVPPQATIPAPLAVPAPVQQAVVQPAQEATTPVLSFGDKLTSGVGYLWKNDKIFLIVFGVLILAGWLSGTLMDLITSKSNKDVAQAKDQDAKLAAKENDAKTQAASYEQAAKDAATNEPQVGEDWNVKK